MYNLNYNFYVCSIKVECDADERRVYGWQMGRWVYNQMESRGGLELSVKLFARLKHRVHM